MLKLKLQYFGHLMQTADSFKKTLMLGKIEGRRRRGWQRMRWLDGITVSMDTGVGDVQEGLECCSPWGCKESDTTEWLIWSDLIIIYGASRVALVVKNLPANEGESWIWSLAQEDPLKEIMATHSSILAWRILWTEKPGGLQSMGQQRVGHN